MNLMYHYLRHQPCRVLYLHKLLVLSHWCGANVPFVSVCGVL